MPFDIWRRLRLDLVKVIEKTIEFLKKHQDDPVYENKLLSIADIRFEFMKPGHAWYDYYTTRRREIFDSQIILTSHSGSDAGLHAEQSATLSDTEKRHVRLLFLILYFVESPKLPAGVDKLL